jgi:hypothetical protein
VAAEEADPPPPTDLEERSEEHSSTIPRKAVVLAVVVLTVMITLIVYGYLDMPGREGSSQLLRELSHSNLFVIPLDEEGEWYRYHHLFSDLLLYELKGSRPDLVPILHGRASAWLEDEKFFDSAIRHAIAVTDLVNLDRVYKRRDFLRSRPSISAMRGMRVDRMTRRQVGCLPTS